MSCAILERDALEAFDRATNPDPNLNDLDDDFEYLFPTLPLPVYDVDWGLSADIDRGQQRKDTPSDSMSILDDPLAELAMQDVISANSARAAEPSFNTSFDTESIANFYAMGSSSPLTCHYSEERENSSIEDNTSQPADDLAPGQKWEIIRHVRSRETH